MDKAEVRRTIVFERDVYERLAEVARREKRTVQGQVEYFVQLGLEAWEREHGHGHS
jgi:hypothetical protein